MIIIDLIAFISYIIFPSGIVYFGDIQMIIGCVVGIRFTLKNINPNQSFFIHGIIVGLGGSILTGISLTMFDWVYFSVSLLFVIVIFEFYFIEAIIIGLALGCFVGAYYNYKKKNRSELSSKDDELLKSLLDK